MNPRYHWKHIDNGYGTTVALWDMHNDCKVNYLPGDVLNFLNIIHEQNVLIDKLMKALETEQKAGLDLARKLTNN